MYIENKIKTEKINVNEDIDKVYKFCQKLHCVLLLFWILLLGSNPHTLNRGHLWHTQFLMGTTRVMTYDRITDLFVVEYTS